MAGAAGKKDAQGYLESYYLVDEILPAQEVHLFAGPSGVGKTRWLLENFVKWAKGESFLGYPSHPVPFVYCAGDRSERSVHRTLKKLGILPSEVPTIPVLDLQKGGAEISLSWLMEQRRLLHPLAKLIILEGISLFVPGGKTNDYASVAKFLSRLTRICGDEDLTFFCVNHMAKQQEGKAYGNPREKIIGSTAWAGYAETLLILDFADAKNSKDPYRRMDVLPRNTANLVLTLKNDPSGRLQQISQGAPNPVSSEKKGRRGDPTTDAAWNCFLGKMRNEGRDDFTVEEIKIALGTDCSRATVYRRIERAIKYHEIVEAGKTGDGVYSLAEL